MTTILILLASLFGAVSAAVSFAIEPSIYLAAGIYALCSFGLLILLVQVATRRQLENHEIANETLNYELMALRESILRDRRFSAGSPDAQEALLFARLRQKELKRGLRPVAHVFA